MNSLQEIQYLKAVWGTVLPSVPAPPDSSFAMWNASFGAKAVETVINEIPYRLTRTTKPPVDAIYRIISSQLKSRKERITAAAVKDSSFDALLKTIPQVELTDQNVARVYSMFILCELAHSPKPDLATFSAAMLTDTIYIQQQSLLESPNTKQVASRALRIVDSLESRQGTGEGAAIARLRKLEDALRSQMKQQAVRE
jgi:hypothetical protein